MNSCSQTMVVSTRGECVYAYDVVSGDLIWKYDQSAPC